jgi:type I restriction enzyme S subunit
VDQYVYSVDSTQVDSFFVAWFMRSPTYLERAPIERTPGQLPRIRTSEVASVHVELPPLQEQRRIATLLDEQMAAVERARAAAEVQLEGARTLSDAQLSIVFQDLTPLSAEGAPQGAPNGWRWYRLTQLARLESGHTPSRYHPEWWGGSVPWLSLTDIRELDGKVAHHTREHTNTEGIANSSARVLPVGTVVLSRTASVGFVTIMGREMATSQDFVNWVCGPDLAPQFLAYLLRASRRYIRSLSSGAIHQTVYMPTVEAFMVCVPGLPEQKRIVAWLDEQAAAASLAWKAAEAQLAAIKALPAALLRRAFSGAL